MVLCILWNCSWINWPTKSIIKTGSSSERNTEEEQNVAQKSGVQQNVTVTSAETDVQEGYINIVIFVLFYI